MSYFKQQTTSRIELPSDEAYWVEVKTHFSYGESKKFIKASTDGTVDPEVAADIFLKQAIVSWNLDDEDGNILPVTDENIARLDMKDAYRLIEKAGGSVEEKKDSAKNLSKASGATTTEPNLRSSQAS